MCLKYCKYHMIRHVGTSPKSAISDLIWSPFGKSFGFLWKNFSFPEPPQKEFKKETPKSSQKDSKKVVLQHSPGVGFLTFFDTFSESFFLGRFWKMGGTPLKDF